MTPRERSKLDPVEIQTLRDWVQMSEDLVALQIVRWFAPVLAQLWPIVHFLVLGTMSLLFVVTSYPFTRQGFLLTGLGGVLAFVALVVGTVLFGTNRDELISRVSDTPPNRLTFDGHLVTSLLTFVVPLLGALAVISFDMADILHTWFGPLSRIF